MHIEEWCGSRTDEAGCGPAGSGRLCGRKRGVMRKKNWIVGLAALLTAASIAGCGSSAATDTASTAASEAGSDTQAESTEASDGTAAGEGDTFIFAQASECKTLDPGVSNYLSSSSLLMNMFMGLEMVGEDGSTVVPGCAESYDVSDDGLVYTFHLYDDLKWSDGSALTAKDFVWSWIRELKPETASGCSNSLYVIKNAEAFANGECTEDEVGVKALDDTTLEITLENPTSYFLDMLCETCFVPVQQAAVEGSSTWSQEADTFVCNGAYMMQQIDHDADYILVKNPYYKYADDVAVDTIKIVFIADATTALTAFKNGEIDATNNLSAQAISEFTGTDTLKTFNTIGTTYFDFNCDNITDARVRQAMGMALDKETICANLMAAKPEPATGFVPYGVSYYEGDEDYRTAVGDLQTYDPEGAKALLDEAVADGYQIPDSIELIVSNNDEVKTIAQAMQAMWKENLGLNIKITTYESNTYWDIYDQHQFDIAYDGWTGDYDDPSTMLECFTQARQGSQWFDDAAMEYEDLMKKAAAETEPETRFGYFEDAEKLLFEDAPMFPLSYKVSQILVSDRVEYFTNDQLNHQLLKYTKLK